MESLLTRISERIIAQGLLTEAKLAECIGAVQMEGCLLDESLFEVGGLAEEKVLPLLAEFLGMDFLPSLNDENVPARFVEEIPVAFARAYGLVGLDESDGVMRVATARPLDVHPMDELASLLKTALDPVLATRSEIIALVNRAYQQKADMVDEAMEGLEEDDILGMTAEMEYTEDVLDLHDKAPIIKFVNMLLFQALKMRASDIHIQPYEDKLGIRYRIDGVLHDVLSPPKKIQDAVISRVKVMGRMDIAERRLPQDGRATIRVGNSEVDLRISSVPTNFGERIVLRLLDKSGRLYDLEQLGAGGSTLEILSNIIRYSHGIFFVTGPTGSGKTTTLYSVLNRINSKEKNIITIEDPIEYHLKGISQIQVSNKKGLTFSAGLRSLLRQDPDIMMVGEVRDRETANIAIQSALTGHLVLSTLHTNDASGAVTRMLDLGVEPYLVSSTVVAALAQRLVRLICLECKESYVPEEGELRDIALTFDDLADGKLYRGVGCDRCMGTGYHDRTGIFELLPVNDTVRRQIMNCEGASFIKKTAVENGLITLRMDGAKKVARGLTTVEEVLNVTQMDLM
jgi:general secretion pathway protein E